jgi:hypothetical protein
MQPEPHSQSPPCQEQHQQTHEAAAEDKQRAEEAGAGAAAAAARRWREELMREIRRRESQVGCPSLAKQQLTAYPYSCQEKSESENVLLC